MEAKKTSPDKVANYLSIIAILISLFSVIQSNGSSKISLESNQISKEAMNLANKNFLFENRPYLVLSPRKITGSEKLFKYSMKGDGISIKAGFEMKNEGKFPARNIEVEVAWLDLVTHEKIQTTNISIPQSSKILPGKLFTFEMSSEVGNSKIKDFMSRAKKDIGLNTFKTIIVVFVNYKSDINNDNSYQTRASYTYDKDGVELINLQEFD